MKGVSTMLLVRCCLFWGMGSKAFKNGLFMTDFGPHSLKDYISLLAELEANFREGGLAIYKAVSSLVGHGAAARIAEAQGFPVPGGLLTKRPSRPQFNLDVIDLASDSDDEAGPSSSRRVPKRGRSSIGVTPVDKRARN